MNKGFSKILAIIIGGLILVSIAVFLLEIVFGAKSREIAECREESRPFEERVIKQNKDDLRFFDDNDKQVLFGQIEKSKTVEELQSNMFYGLSEVFDRYNSDLRPDEYMLSPEFLINKPEGVEITVCNKTTDYLKGIGLEPITNADMPKLKAFAKMFVEEYSKYPISWMVESTPPVFVWVKRLEVNGELAGGLHNGIIVYNIAPTLENEEYTRKTIHHEIWHWIEHKSGLSGDPKWPGDNFTYLSSVFETGEIFAEHGTSGFVTNYAKVSPREDRAETYSYLFFPKELAKLENWSKEDKALGEKELYLKKIIKERVQKMNNDFFDNHIKSAP